MPAQDDQQKILEAGTDRKDEEYTVFLPMELLYAW